MVKFGFYPSKLKKQTFLLKFSKSRGGLRHPPFRRPWTEDEHQKTWSTNFERMGHEKKTHFCDENPFTDNFFHCAKPYNFICIAATNATGTLPGPFAPPLASLPRRKITARSYSCTTWKQTATVTWLRRMKLCLNVTSLGQPGLYVR